MRTDKIWEIDEVINSLRNYRNFHGLTTIEIRFINKVIPFNIIRTSAEANKLIAKHFDKIVCERESIPKNIKDSIIKEDVMYFFSERGSSTIIKKHIIKNYIFLYPLIINNHFHTLRLWNCFFRQLHIISLNFNEIDIKNCYFTNKVYLSNIKGSSSTFIRNSFFIRELIGSNLELDICSFYNCEFNGLQLIKSNINNISFINSVFKVSHTNIVIHSVETVIDLLNFDGSLFEKMPYNLSKVTRTLSLKNVKSLKAINLYMKLIEHIEINDEFIDKNNFTTITASQFKNYFNEIGNYNFSDKFYIKQIISINKNNKDLLFKYIINPLWWFTSKYGTSFLRWITTLNILSFIFGLTYFFNAHWFNIKKWARSSTPFYFSFVTFTTLGFGDVTPKTSIGELIVTIEVVIGYLMFGGLLTIFSRKINRK